MPEPPDPARTVFQPKPSGGAESAGAEDAWFGKSNTSASQATPVPDERAAARTVFQPSPPHEPAGVGADHRWPGTPRDSFGSANLDSVPGVLPAVPSTGGNWLN